MIQLYAKSFLDQNLADLKKWKKDAFQQFGEIVGDEADTFPCVPGRQGFFLDHLRYGFVGDPRRQETVDEIAELLKVYQDCSRETGQYASLILMFETPDDLRSMSVTSYEELFWDLVKRLHHQDEAAWPEDVPNDPEHHQWEFCFNGEPYFLLCSTPAHQLRKSRSFPYFLMALQPRWVFEKLNGSTSFGQKMSQLIRKRLKAYDQVDIHPSLKWYGDKTNHEWKQYFLSDDEAEKPPSAKCPFTAIKNRMKL
ncbi:YqcI/YcgG family protein [Bacillus sp. NPDC077027]|uniref:YqcI/YcgG family protein n=1 Tax=Bacillus sp. NPDC077027 TaxID=3390548 RepID=UPI003D061986